ncbi:MAG: hypothetical protein JNK67_27630 [Alphaproteobacteria bacterium]|nr:hypothetical protein [Alphaproteobacteria bacterium]
MKTLLSRSLAALALCALLTGCARFESAFAPTGGTPTGNLNRLDGGYGGTANYARGPERCARRLNIALTVNNGRFQGEVRDPRVPNASPARFDGYIETDGAMASIVRAGGEVLVLRGRFIESRFDGTMIPEEWVDPTRENPREGRTNLGFSTANSYCTWLVRLPRQGG